MKNNLDYLNINYEKLIVYIKNKQPKDSAELTFAIRSFLGINDYKLVNKIVRILIELDSSIREIELTWFNPRGLNRGLDKINIEFKIIDISI